MSQKLREQVLRRMGRLTEITKIVDRNRSDGIFGREDENQIFYVFDTNVVQMFLEAFRNPQHAELFHSSAWGRDYAEYDSVNRQACLLIGEYLMSGLLPGQREGRWFMSQSHFNELEVQTKWLEQEIQDNIARLKRDDKFRARGLAVQDEIQRTLALDPTRDRGTIIALARRHGDGETEAAELANLSGKDFASRAAAIRSRELCRILAKDRLFEPVDQLRRFRSRQIIGKMRPIEQMFEPKAGDLAEIERERLAWSEQLRDVINERPKNSRTDTAIDNDSETLAHLTWVMRRRLKGNEKIVLVTGDRALYDAYRRRHIEQPSGLPFLVRPPTQYAPLFNPVSAASSMAHRNDAFDRIRAALEAGAVALNLSLFSKNERENDNKSSARDHFILESDRPEGKAAWMVDRIFPGLFNDEKLSESNRLLEGLISPLQDVEKLMLGAYPDLLAQRIEAREKREIFLAGAVDGGGLSDALQDRLNIASRHGFMFSLPLMPQAIMKLRNRINPDGRVRGRLALGVRLPFPRVVNGVVSDQDEVISRLEILERLSRDEAYLAVLPDILERLADTPERIFGLAAVLAFAVEDWETAARYADLAATASETSQTDPGEDHFELLYMKAVSLRFLMSNLEPDPINAVHDAWAQWLKDAEGALGRGLEYHDALDHQARVIRGYSERAAVRLAYCEWFAFGALSQARFFQEDGAVAAIGELFTAGVDDLLACYDRIEAAIARANDEERPEFRQTRETLASAQAQFSVNTAAAVLVGEALALWADPELAALAEREIRRLPRAIDWPSGQLQPITRAYILAARNDWKGVLDLETNALTLPLDATVIRALRRRASDALIAEEV